MGWSYGVNSRGREVGYSVDATCDQDGCEAKIDRGLAYVCGGMHDGGEDGCGDYFCSTHLFLTGWEDGSTYPGSYLCASCCDEWERNNPDPDPERNDASLT